MWALEKGMYLAAALFTAGAYVCVVQICGLGTNIFACVIIGLAAGMAIGKVAEPPPPRALGRRGGTPFTPHRV